MFVDDAAMHWKRLEFLPFKMRELWSTKSSVRDVYFFLNKEKFILAFAANFIPSTTRFLVIVYV